MKLSISNIAWLPEENDQIAKLLVQKGIRHLEVAPTTIAPDPLQVTSKMLVGARHFWSEHGLTIIAMQALLYGRPDLTIFDSEAIRMRTVDYLRRIMDFGQELGAGVLVFGSPKNRRTGDLPEDDVREIEREFFENIGALASQRGLVFGIEPNPPIYDCDYLNTSSDVADLVKRIDSPGIAVHLDAAAMTLAGEKPSALHDISPAHIAHFHVSEPHLSEIGTGGVPHSDFAEKLRAIGYQGYVSIEMRPEREITGANLERVRRALTLAEKAYIAGLQTPEESDGLDEDMS